MGLRNGSSGEFFVGSFGEFSPAIDIGKGSTPQARNLSVEERISAIFCSTLTTLLAAFTLSHACMLLSPTSSAFHLCLPNTTP